MSQFNFAVVTISTVGYSELPRMDLHPSSRILVMGMIVSGVATVALFQSSLTTLMIEGIIGKAFRRRFMERRIRALSSHTIVAGCGRTGRFVIEELFASEWPHVGGDAAVRQAVSVMECCAQPQGRGVFGRSARGAACDGCANAIEWPAHGNKDARAGPGGG